MVREEIEKRMEEKDDEEEEEEDVVDEIARTRAQRNSSLSSVPFGPCPLLD